ncbi:MAG: chorismate synthase [Veillonellales bacterium]
MMRYLTGGESHGSGLIGMIEGFPARVGMDIAVINRDLARRQQGYGRGGRMAIETDKIQFLSGVRGGKSLGSPISFSIANKDYENWIPYMNPVKIESDDKQVTAPRPGHADLPGSIKYGFDDIRNVLERSSARETAVRVAIGSIVRQLLQNFDIAAACHVVSIGGIAAVVSNYSFADLARAEESPVRVVDPQAEQRIIERIDQAKREGESLGGVFEIVITGVPVGLGSYVQWDRKLDGRLAYALQSIQAIKGVEFGGGFACASQQGSAVHDEIFYSPEQGYYRRTNNAGGIEGGMSNGQDIVIRCAMKPIPTLYKPLRTVDIKTKASCTAAVERSDICAVPAAAVVGEAAALTVIGEEFLRKFGGDSLEEITERWEQWERQ